MGNRVKVTEMMYGWSKYGGPRYGMVRDEQDWFCQICGEKQPKEMAQYMIPIDDFQRDFVRVCSVCKHNQHLSKLSYRKLCIKLRVKEKYAEE